MVANMIQEQLKLAVVLPDLGSNDSSMSCTDTNEDDENLASENAIDIESDEAVETANEDSTRDTDLADNGHNDDSHTFDSQIISIDELEKESDLLYNVAAREKINMVDEAYADNGLLHEDSIPDTNKRESGATDYVAVQETMIVEDEPTVDDKLREDLVVDTNLRESALHGTAAALEEMIIEDESTVDGGIFSEASDLNIIEAQNITSDLALVSPPTEQKQSDVVSSEISNSSTSMPKKVSAFGSFKNLSDGAKGRAGGIMTNLNFGANGEGRRHVLNTMFVKGMRSSNLIARGVAPAARRAVQAMDRKRAQVLMSNGHRNDDAQIGDIGDGLHSFDTFDNTEDLVSANMTSEDLECVECVEAIRLLLVQSRVARGKLSPEKAALTLSRQSTSPMKRPEFVDDAVVDAGDIDARLAGCGLVSNAIYSAINLWKKGLVNNGEVLDLIQKDLQFTQVSLPGSENETILIEDSAFWGRFAFGERWAEKKSRIQSSSKFGSQPGWDLDGYIIKANDDLRQEAFAMQLIELSKEAFEIAGLELWIHPYRILATGRTTGVIEMVRNAMSFDSLKKRPGYNEGGLLGHFRKMAEHAADPMETLMTAKRNFVRSLAAYSLLSHFFLFKDRHNGNLLLDTAGHVIHIDFGFIFGIAPGGSFSLESSVPFKLTEEMIEVMDGLGSTLFSEFVTLFCCGFLAMQAHAETFVTIVRITCEGSTFKCFEGKDIREIVYKLRERFCPDLNKEATIAHAMDLIRQATNASGTKQYDFFQYLSQGIAA